MLEWLGAEGAVIASALQRIFRRQGTAFGSAALHWGGMYDGADGVQWNMGVDPRIPERWVGVNLEGLLYDGWPLARLINKELIRPTLPAFVAGHRGMEEVWVSMDREYWTARNRAHWETIADRPIAGLTDAEWRQILSEARECLASGSGGRAQGTFLSKAGLKTTADLTPHLLFRIKAPLVQDWE